MQNIIPWTLIQVANATNIVAGVIIAHVLSPYEFGRFATMSAALTIMCSILNPLMNELAHFVSKTGTIHLDSLRKRTIASLVACLGVAIVTCRTIVDSVSEACALYAALPVTLIASTWIVGIMIGLNRMSAVGLTQVGGALTKLLLLGIGLLYLPSVTTISWAYAVSFAVIVALGLKRIRPIRAEHDRDADIQWSIIAGLFLLALPFSLDQALIQAWYPHVSGEYAAVMTYAKSVLLIAAPALTIAYSSALKRSSEGLRRVELARSLALFSGFAAPLGALFWFLHPWLFPLLLGPQYSHVMDNVGMALLAMALHVAAFSVIQIRVIRSRWWVIVALTIPVALQATLLRFFAISSVESLVVIGAWTFLAQALLALLMAVIPTRS